MSCDRREGRRRRREQVVAEGLERAARAATASARIRKSCSSLSTVSRCVASNSRQSRHRDRGEPGQIEGARNASGGTDYRDARCRSGGRVSRSRLRRARSTQHPAVSVPAAGAVRRCRRGTCGADRRPVGRASAARTSEPEASARAPAPPIAAAGSRRSMCRRACSRRLIRLRPVAQVFLPISVAHRTSGQSGLGRDRRRTRWSPARRSTGVPARLTHRLENRLLLIGRQVLEDLDLLCCRRLGDRWKPADEPRLRTAGHDATRCGPASHHVRLCMRLS